MFDINSQIHLKIGTKCTSVLYTITEQFLKYVF